VGSSGEHKCWLHVLLRVRLGSLKRSRDSTNDGHRSGLGRVVLLVSEQLAYYAL
jgi:hypothetical protein